MKKYIMTATLLFVSLFCLSINSFASEPEDYSITITKLSDTGQKLTPISGQKEDTSSLKPIKDLSYQVERVTVENSKFIPLKGADSFLSVRDTNANGEVFFNNLKQGIYKITELSNEKGVMEPIILELPLSQEDGTILNDVFIYPKPTAFTPVQDKEIEKYPPTSGNLGNTTVIYVSIVILISFFVIFLYLNKNNKSKY